MLTIGQGATQALNMKVLIAYATTEGQTRKICEWIGDWARQKGHDVCVVDCGLADENTNVSGFDKYIVAGSLHMERHQPELERFVKWHRKSLQSAPSAFLSVSATASRKDRASQIAAGECVRNFIERTEWRPNVWEAVGGAIKYTKYNFLVRAVMKRISAKNGGPTDTSRDHELTDWTALERFLETFLGEQPYRKLSLTSSAAPLNDKVPPSVQVRTVRQQ
jgi:menaquinone-dependent protoporphyrinogen oxidase